MPTRSLARDLLAGLLAMGMIASAPAADEAPKTLARLLSEASRGGDYRPAESAELAAAASIFTALTAGDPATASAQAGPFGVSLRAVAEPAATAVIENADARRGRPVVAVRATGAAVMLQIPHAFKDEMTREIGLRLFQESPARIAIWNTVPRHYERAGVRVDADMAHLPQTWFTALTTAFASAAPAGRIVQIHGFDPDKRKSAAGAAADFVLSNGTANPGTALRQAATCLARGLAADVRLYPETIRELGGTTNAQVAALRGQGFAGFVHVEISRPMRERLLADAGARKFFVDCLIEVRGNP